MLSWSVSKPKDCTKGCAVNGAWVNPGELIRDQVATNDARESHSGEADNVPATAVTSSEHGEPVQQEAEDAVDAESIVSIGDFLAEGRLTDDSIILIRPEFAYMLRSHATAFMNAVLEIEKKIGRKPKFRDVFRPTWYQQELRDKYLKEKEAYDSCYFRCGNEPALADKPGTSTHQAGASFDLPLNEVNNFTPDEETTVIETFARAGFGRNISEEPWHFTIKGYATLRDNDPAGLQNKINIIQNRWVNAVSR